MKQIGVTDPPKFFDEGVKSDKDLQELLKSFPYAWKTFHHLKQQYKGRREVDDLTFHLYIAVWDGRIAHLSTILEKH